VHLDSTNIRILNLLSRNARASITDLAEAVGRSETTVRERLSNLEAQGIVLGYCLRLDLAKAGLPLHAVIRARCDMRRAAEIGRRLSAIPEVLEARLTTGPRPLRIVVCAKDSEALEHLLATRIAPLELDGQQIDVTLQTLVPSRSPDLGLLAGPEPVKPMVSFVHPTV
jgi:Lrp/AsnC family transcriptional regulator, leucine-responsive regulatory protein